MGIPGLCSHCFFHLTLPMTLVSLKSSILLYWWRVSACWRQNSPTLLFKPSHHSHSLTFPWKRLTAMCVRLLNHTCILLKNVGCHRKGGSGCIRSRRALVSTQIWVSPSPWFGWGPGCALGVSFPMVSGRLRLSAVIHLCFHSLSHRQTLLTELIL